MSNNSVNDKITKITGEFMKEYVKNPDLIKFDFNENGKGLFENRKKNLKIDAFAHILTPKFYEDLKELNPKIPQIFSTVLNPSLLDVEERRKFQKEYSDVKQIISMFNLNPEDFLRAENEEERKRNAEKTLQITWDANNELTETVKNNKDLFIGAVATVPMNNIEGALKIINNQVSENDELAGIQLFSKALGKSIASDEYLPIFEAAEKNDITVFLHPVYDMTKNDNNIVFSWEYEQSQAMNEIVLAGIFKKYPNIKILVHHAGAMVPFFANRLPLVMPKEYAEDFKKFYVDTAIIGNVKAVEMAVDYFGEDKVVFGTDAPVGIQPSGPTKIVIESIEKLNKGEDIKEKIYRKNVEQLLKI